MAATKLRVWAFSPEGDPSKVARAMARAEAVHLFPEDISRGRPMGGLVVVPAVVTLYDSEEEFIKAEGRRNARQPWEDAEVAYMIMLPADIDATEIKELFRGMKGIPAPFPPEVVTGLKQRIEEIIQAQVDTPFTSQEFWAAHWLTIHDDGLIAFTEAADLFDMVPPDQRFYTRHKPKGDK